MKKFLCFCLSFGAFTSLFSQNSVMGKDNVVRNPNEINVTFLGETDPIGTKVIDAHTVYPTTKHIKLGYHPKGDWVLNENVNPNALPKNGDEALQKDYNTNTRRSTEIANWQGITTTTSPGDPAMDVGPNHVVQMMNGSSGASVQIWDKSGGSLLGNSDFSTLVNLPNAGLGDPIVLYDERADRWLLSEFCSGCNDMFVAISTTSDPLGSYYTYSIAASSFPDYPKYSIWDNTYLITANEGTGTSTVYALDRNAMLTGGAANAQQFTIPRFGTIGFQASTPVSLMGTTTAGTPPMLMRMRDDAWTGSGSDALEIWELDIDWSSPGAATLTQTSTLGTTPHESELCGYTSFACIPQQGSGTTLDPLRELLMNRIMYRNFGTHESIVCAHVTDVDGNDLAGIRWYELRRTGGGAGTWSIYQESTYSPDSDMRWMPTIGISESGNIGLAYNVSSSSMYPSIRYTGRKECDPLNVMTETEVTLVAGTTANNSNRWGDYNAMGVDGETFWFTAMYNPNSQARTRIGAFTIDPCNPAVQFTNATYDVNEGDANVANGCLDYYILDVPIQIGIDPTQPADITINVTGGTATQGVDYDISNTTFTLDGTTLVGTAEIWVYNDNNTEGNENITLDYTLNANGGNAIAGALNQTVTITINDDDLAPAAMSNTVTILNEDFETGFGGFSAVNPSGDTPWQIGDNAAAASGPYAIPTSNTTDFAWVNDDACDCDQNAVDLVFPTLDLTGYTSANLSFYTYFEDNTYNGDNENADLMVSVGGGAFNAVGALTASTIDGSWVTQNFDVSAYTGVGFSDVVFAVRYSDATGWLYGCTVDDVLLTGTIPIDIQTAVNTGSGMQANLGPNETVHFYDPATNDVMMSIVNSSSFDYGCVTVDVDRDGSTPTALPFASAVTADFLHSKTYTVVPTNSNPAGTFDVTLYYKEAEVNAWETVTGNSRNDLEIIKVLGNNRINDVTPGNYTSYTINNVTATIGSFNSDVTLTASFNNGFSGFGAGIYNISTVTVTHTTVNVDPDCNGGSNGSITVTASGGTGPYTYSINGGTSFQSSNVFNGLSANTYSVIAMDAGSNQSIASSVTLTNPTLLTSSSTATNENCGSTDGTITITASGGTGTLQYSINGGTTFQTGNTFSGLTANSYNIVVEDANSCQSTGTQTVGTTAGPTFTSSATNENCGNTDGTITINASGGTGTLQYSINGGSTFQTGNTFSGLAANSYNIVVEDANSCPSTGTQTVGTTAGPTFTSSATNENCGNTDGTITINASGGTGTLQYSINGGSTFQTGNTFSGLAANSYNIVVEDANSCLSTGTQTVGTTAGPTFTSSATNENCGNTDGTITINASGGTGTLQYSINGGTTFQTGNTFSGLAANSYNIVVEDANSCQSTGSQTIGTTGGPTITSSTSTDADCNGASTGSITIIASGGTGALQYSIDGGTSFQGSGSFTGISANSYSIVVQDANMCQTTSSVIVDEPTGMSLSLSSSPANCSSSNGSISVSASGGSNPKTYSIDGGVTFQANGNFNGLNSGNYNVVVQDANNCQVTGNITVSNTSGPVISSATRTNVSCNGGSDGTITIIATGAATLQYSIDGGTSFQANNIFNGLTAGTYNIAVLDGNTCQTAGGSLIIGQPSLISLSSSATNELCGNSDGTITITASGGTGTLQYSNDGGTTFQTSNVFLGLSSILYNLVVEDANGCQVTTNQTVGATAGPTFTSSATNENCGNTDGTITINASGGTGTIQYSINGGTTFQTGNTFSGLSNNSYNIVVEDANGCQSSGTQNVGTTAGPTFTSSATNVNCSHADGTITITATGGTGTILYSIDGGTSFQTGNTFSGLTSTTYNIVIEDVNGCQSSGTQSVGNTAGPSLSSINKTDATCNGSTDGTITVNATGTATLQYSNDNGVTFQTGNVFNGLSAGPYMIVVEDGNGCQTFAGTINITQPGAINISSTSVNENCGAGDGSITITASGGVGTLQYSADGGSNFQSSGIFNGLAASGYNIVVEDANGCQNTTTESVSSNGGPTINNVSTIDPTCNNGSDGSIDITATGTATLQYSINGGTSFATSSSFTGLSDGNYNVMVEDGNGCQTSGGAISITEPTPITISTNSNNENCGNNDGSITITASGGTGTLQYSINGGTSFQSNGIFNGLTTANYNIVVEDIRGCQNTATETVGSNGGPTINSVSSTDESCFGSNDGTITIDASLSGTIQYSIDGGLTYSPSPIFNSLIAGSYDIAVTNGSGCVTTAPAEIISSPNQITYSAVVADENCGANDGGITITATNNIGTTSYSIDGGVSTQSSSVFTGLGSGAYNIVIEDNNGCQATGTENVNSNGGPTISVVNTTDLTCFGDTDGEISITASGGTGAFQYSFDGGVTFQTSNSLAGLSDGNYNVVVEDANNCSASNSTTINSPTEITSTITATDATCGANDGTATVSAIGGTGTLTFQWDDAGNQTNATATGLASGLFTVIIEDNNGCTSSNSINVNSIGQATLTTTTSNVSCFGLSDGSASVTASGGSTPYTFAWDDPAMQTNATATALAAGNYTIDVTDNTGCVSSTTVTISEPDELLVTLSSIHTSCAQDNGIAMSAVTGGTAPYTYAWDDAANQTTSTAINLSAGNYNIVVTDANNCPNSASLTINDSDSMVVNLEVVHESCPDQSDGSIATEISGGQPPYQYNWSTGDTTDILYGLPIGSYTLTVADALNCSVILVIPIENEGGQCIKIPTAISPNSDGSNDTWVIDGLSNYPDAVVEVYNRWGGLIISSNDYQNDWDGTYNGENVAAGVYYFVVTIDEETTYTGSLTVIR